MDFTTHQRAYATRQLPNREVIEFYHQGVGDTKTAALVLEACQFIGINPMITIPDVWVIRRGSQKVWGEIGIKEELDDAAARVWKNWGSVEKKLVA